MDRENRRTCRKKGKYIGKAYRKKGKTCRKRENMKEKKESI